MNGLICLKCTLPICDESLPECLYKTEVRAQWNKKTAKYRQNPQKRILIRAAWKKASAKYRQDREKRILVERRYREKHRDAINAWRREKRLEKAG